MGFSASTLNNHFDPQSPTSEHACLVANTLQDLRLTALDVHTRIQSSSLPMRLVHVAEHSR